MLHVAFAAILAVHALLHLLGFAKGFELASLGQLRVPISRPMGLVWLAAALALLAAVVVLFAAPRWFWIVGGIGLIASQLVIVASWNDARFGTFANVLLFAAVVHSAFSRGPFGVRAEYERLVRQGIAEVEGAPPSRMVTEMDLATLPSAVQRYLRFVGAVGSPRPVGFRARITGRIRASVAAEWMPFAAEQVNFFGPPRRYFFMEATRAGLPLDGLHTYGESDASMRIRLLSMYPVVDVHGADMMRAETVTLLNDMAIFAPGALLDPAIRWRELDPSRVEATYTNPPHTIRSVLVFDDSGALVDFWSDDRPALAEDGRTLVPQRWSTPLRDYRTLGSQRLATRGEGRYAAPDGEYAYLELEVLEVTTVPLEHFAVR